MSLAFCCWGRKTCSSGFETKSKTNDRFARDEASIGTAGVMLRLCGCIPLGRRIRPNRNDLICCQSCIFSNDAGSQKLAAKNDGRGKQQTRVVSYASPKGGSTASCESESRKNDQLSVPILFSAAIPEQPVRLHDRVHCSSSSRFLRSSDGARIKAERANRTSTARGRSGDLVARRLDRILPSR